MERTVVIETLQKKAPKVHCLTNPVTMQDVANILLAAGGSAHGLTRMKQRFWVFSIHMPFQI